MIILLCKRYEADIVYVLWTKDWFMAMNKAVNSGVKW